jgi:hypothetical protein
MGRAMLKLLIGYDGSEPADIAIRELHRAGLPGDVEATVLSVADLPTEVPYANYGSQTEGVKGLPPLVVLAACPLPASRRYTKAKHATAGISPRGPRFAVPCFRPAPSHE